MTKFAIIATVEVAPGRLQEYLPLALAHRARCMKDEPGTLQFEYLRVNGDDTKLMIYEAYENEAAFNEHFNASSRAQLAKESAGMVLKVSGIKCTTLA